MDKNVIGLNAGVLWRLMNQDCQHRWRLNELKESTGFDDMELASAIGWLAREDKLQFELHNSEGSGKEAYVYLMLNTYF